MKKVFTFIAALVLTATAANAQSDILKGLASKVQSAAQNSKSSVVSSLAGSVISKVIPTATQLEGTWNYQKPAVMFTSDNALTQLAGSAGTSSVENKLQTYLNSIGIKKGAFSVTFNSDKSFKVTKGTKILASGTYTINSSDISLTFNGQTKVSKITPQLVSGSLVVVMDATNLKNFLTSIGSNVSGLSTITTLLNKYKGMKVGIRMSK